MYNPNNTTQGPAPIRTPQAEGAARALRGIAGMLRKGIQVVEALQGQPMNSVHRDSIENDADLAEGYAVDFERHGDRVFGNIEKIVNETVQQSTTAVAGGVEARLLSLLQSAIEGVPSGQGVVLDEAHYIKTTPTPTARQTAQNPFREKFGTQSVNYRRNSR